MKSIRIRLLVSVLTVFVIALLILTVLSYKETVHEIEEVFDAELAQTARMINQLTLANIDSKGIDVSIPVSYEQQGHKYEKHISYQIWYHDTLVLRSESAPIDRSMSNVSGYSDSNIGGRDWRVFALYPQSSAYRIYTAEDQKAREELSWEIVVESLEVYFWSIPILAILFYITLSHGLASLKHISEDVSLRDVNKLKPLNKDKVPSEVLPLVSALNELLARLDVAMLKERRFTADASHELKTPLSGIRLHAQLAMQAEKEEDRKHALIQIINAVDNSSHLVEQLLTLTRLDPADISLAIAPVNLISLCNDLIVEMRQTTDSTHKEITFECDQQDLSINSNRNLLYTLLRNLLDNAIQHTNEDTAIKLSIITDSNSIIISVLDNGPGIPEAQIERVTQRFFRLSGQDIKGCGLGLSIALEAAHRLGAQFQLSNRDDGISGLLAKITLPL